MQRLGGLLRRLTIQATDLATCTSEQTFSCALPSARSVASPSTTAGSAWQHIRCLGFGSSSVCQQEFISLNTLRDNPGATHSKKRRGRGVGSGLGKTAGRGHKGQKARAGRSPKIGFEGGQTPLRQRVPKRGFRNPSALNYVPLNLTKLMKCVETKQLDTSQVITMKDLRDCGAVHRNVGDGIKLLARGSPSLREKQLPIHVQVSSASAEARSAIEAAGGSVTTVYYNTLGMRALLQPDFFRRHERLLPRPARPPPRLADGRFDVIGSLPPDTRIGQPVPEGGVTHEVLGMRTGVSNRQRIASSIVAEQNGG